MVPVALLCEGLTDHAVLRKLLEGYSSDHVSLNRVFPPDPMRPNVDFGGWLELFNAIGRREVSAALLFNDLVVMQVDTDVCEEPQFGVPRREGGRELTEAELAARVVTRLCDKIAEGDPAADLTRVVFAVCVNELECWLLLHLTDRKPKTVGCLAAANEAIQKANGIRLGTKKDKNVRAYEAAAHGLRRRAAVDALRHRAPSLDAFLAQLDEKLAPLL